MVPSVKAANSQSYEMTGTIHGFYHGKSEVSGSNRWSNGGSRLRTKTQHMLEKNVIPFQMKNNRKRAARFNLTKNETTTTKQI